MAAEAVAGEGERSGGSYEGRRGAEAIAREIEGYGGRFQAWKWTGMLLTGKGEEPAGKREARGGAESYLPTGR